MCGIVGIISASDDGRWLGQGNLEAMRDEMAHRGPDGSGLHIGWRFGLGHRRLSILDVSDRGLQPMLWGDLAITYNGEIYNFAEIREELVGLGHEFVSGTDTEVILHAYGEWGERCLERFNGMFAFGIVDAGAGTFFIARDRLGEKPLYVHRTDEYLVFASEIKAICKFSGYTAEINEGAIFDFLRYTFVPGEDTLFKGVKELLPGHYAVGSFAGDKLTYSSVRYWDLPRRRRQVSFAEAEKEAERLLEQSVRRRMIADVPVGLQLSGGLDSSLVAAYASRVGDRLKAFSVDVRGAGYSERDYAVQAAKKFGLDQVIIDLDFEELSKSLQRLMYVYDEPLPHANSLGIFALSRRAKQDVTVLLSGEGADELFCGYTRYDELARFRLVSWIPWKRLRKLAAKKLLPNSGYVYLVSEQERPPGDFYIRKVINSYSDAAVRDMLRDGIPAKTGSYFDETLAGLDGQEYLNKASGYDLKNYLVSLLQRQDRMSMAAGIENRAPFLDHDLVEYVYSLPANFKYHGRVGKRLLKKIAEKFFGRDFVYRPKMGFAIPIGEWLGGEAGERLVESVLGNRLLAERLFKKDRLAEAVRGFRAGDPSSTQLLWTLVCLDAWARAFFPGACGPEPAKQSST